MWPRRKNEDYIAVREMPKQGRSVFVLSDGMGAHYLGEVASLLIALSVKSENSSSFFIIQCNN